MSAVSPARTRERGLKRPTAVAPAPRGAWPLGVPGAYGIDDARLMHYARLAKTAAGFRQYLDEFVLKTVAA